MAATTHTYDLRSWERNRNIVGKADKECGDSDGDSNGGGDDE